MTDSVAQARRWLDRLTTNVDTVSDPQAPAAGETSAATAAAAQAAMTAALDQHAAAVRDILAHGVPTGAGAPGVLLLAGYAQGLLAGPAHSPTVPPAPVLPAPSAVGAAAGPSGGAARDAWLALRLRAVCALAARPDGWRPLVPA